MHGDAGYLPGTAASATTTTTRPPTPATTRPADGLTRDTAAETVIFNQHNQARAAAGLGPLVRNACVDGVASEWTRYMAFFGDMPHNPAHPAPPKACAPGPVRPWGESTAPWQTPPQLNDF